MVDFVIVKCEVLERSNKTSDCGTIDYGFATEQSENEGSD